jgi:hypothetical protein
MFLPADEMFPMLSSIGKHTFIYSKHKDTGDFLDQMSQNKAFSSFCYINNVQL